MPRYLLSVHGPAERETGTHPAGEAVPQAFADTGAFDERLQRNGHLVFAGGLEPAMTATTVDGQGGRPVFTDGPHLRQAQECLDGFWVIEAADLDVALALAAEGSRVCRGPVEVRPFRTTEPGQALPRL